MYLIIQVNGEETYFFSTLCQDDIYRYTSILVSGSWLVCKFGNDELFKMFSNIGALQVLHYRPIGSFFIFEMPGTVISFFISRTEFTCTYSF